MPVLLTVTDKDSKDQPIGNKLRFDRSVITLGRNPSNDVQLVSLAVSRNHARIVREEEDYWLIDCGSTGGTYLNGYRLAANEKRALKDGDLIRIANFEIVFNIEVDKRPEEGTKTFIIRKFSEMLEQVRLDRASPFLIVKGGVDDGRKVVLSEEPAEILLGRGEECDVIIRDETISRVHAKVRRDSSGITIHDLNSDNGVFVNGVRIEGCCRLKDQDEIRLGQSTRANPVVLIFSDPRELSSAATPLEISLPRIPSPQGTAAELKQQAEGSVGLAERSYSDEGKAALATGQQEIKPEAGSGTLAQGRWTGYWGEKLRSFTAVEIILMALGLLFLLVSIASIIAFVIASTP